MLNWQTAFFASRMGSSSAGQTRTKMFAGVKGKHADEVLKNVTDTQKENVLSFAGWLLDVENYPKNIDLENYWGAPFFVTPAGPSQKAEMEVNPQQTPESKSDS